ncbi:MAG TPA: hypothetical protein VK424_00750 [Thermoplasmata archaeon]|nr:hypothetical protein [Thermoplasmata archaeon]
MVFVADWGSTFDAPIDVVWAYLQAETEHGPSHKGRRNFERKQVNDMTAMLAWEQDIDGHWVRIASNITFHPPVGFFVETLEGPMAGSKFFNYYVPKGEKTEVVVVGHWNSKMIPPAQLEAAVMANLQKLYDEDSAGLKGFSRKK